MEVALSSGRSLWVDGCQRKIIILGRAPFCDILEAGSNRNPLTKIGQALAWPSIGPRILEEAKMHNTQAIFKGNL